MNPSQREAIQKFTKEIIDTCGITIQVFLDNLMQHQVLSWEERELVNSQMTNSSKMLLVLRMLHVKDNGWDVIVRFLRENGYRRLAESLEEEVNPPAPVPEPNKSERVQLLQMPRIDPSPTSPQDSTESSNIEEPPEPRNLKSIEGWVYDESDEGLLGEGSYGRVYRCSRQSDNLKAAIKVVKGGNLERIRNELSILRILGSDSSHLLKFLHVTTQRSCLYFICELCKDGNLRAYINEKKQLTLPILSCLIVQMADAYKVLFEHKICHRDIKPENILLSDKSDVGFCAKLADFDFAKVTQSESQSFKSLKGTLDYMAPEIASAIWEDKKEYDSRVDVWSFGLVFHECFTGKLLFDSKLKSEIIPMVQRKKNLRKALDAPTGCPTLLKDLLEKMLAIYPAARMKAPEFFEHPFVKANTAAVNVVKSYFNTLNDYFGDSNVFREEK